MRQRALILVLLATCLIGLLSSAHAGQRQREDPVRNYDDVYFWAPETGWVADVREVVLTRDGGRTWTPILSVYGPPRGLGIIRPIGTLNPQVWWFEDSGNLWKTGDQGRTWSSLRIPSLGGGRLCGADRGVGDSNRRRGPHAHPGWGPDLAVGPASGDRHPPAEDSTPSLPLAPSGVGRNRGWEYSPDHRRWADMDTPRQSPRWFSLFHVPGRPDRVCP